MFNIGDKVIWVDDFTEIKGVVVDYSPTSKWYVIKWDNGRSISYPQDRIDELSYAIKLDLVSIREMKLIDLLM
jgi:hypothetical protein